MKSILSFISSDLRKNLLRSWQFRPVKGDEKNLTCSHTETRLFVVCSVEVKICKVLCFFYFELWLIIRQLSMACNVDESKSFELKGTIKIIIVIKKKLYSKTVFFKAHATWCCSVDQESRNVSNFGFWDTCNTIW